MTADPQIQAPAAPVADGMTRLVTTLFTLAIALLLLPLAVPRIAIAIGGDTIATRARFWQIHRHHTLANVIGVALVAALMTVEGVCAARSWSGFFASPDWPHELVPALAPWLVANFLSGVFLLPITWSWHRRQIAARVRARRVKDVIQQTRIEAARKRAADHAAATRIGVHLDTTTGKITGTSTTPTTSPHLVEGRAEFGTLTAATVRTVSERFRDTRQVRDWITADAIALPPSSSAVRALVVAESGSGKTVLLNGMVLCALTYGWPVFVIDAKGDPEDAHALAALARSLGRTASTGGVWNMFAGTADQITSKLMRLMPPPDGANQHYLDEIRGILQAIQWESPLESVDDLKERLRRPSAHVRDQFDLNLVNAPVDRNGTTAADRVLRALLVALRPLEAWISDTGWTYQHPAADVTVVSLTPVDDAQARIGDLLLLDLRNYLATRLAAGDKSPVLVVVDEFPQLITGTSDPGDTAGSLFETARSAGVGLVLATQSPAGLSNDEIRRRRALTSGAALIFGRSKDPEEVVAYAGTVMQMEAAGTASGEELKTARAQHTFVIPPQDVREAADGAFWLVQAGAIAPFRALPTPTPATPDVVGAGHPATAPTEHGADDDVDDRVLEREKASEL